MKMTQTEARRRLDLVGVASGTVLTGTSTITIDTVAFDKIINLAQAGLAHAPFRAERFTPYHQPSPRGTIA